MDDVFKLLFAAGVALAGGLQAAETEIAPRTPWNAGAPRFNGARAFGATPGRTFRHAIPLRGDRRDLRFAVVKGALPKGVALDAKTGLLSGRATDVGTHRFTVCASNACGAAERELALVIGDGARAQCPAMGWSSWNAHTYYVSADRVRRAAHALVDSGLAARGYEYVNVDSCWQGSRDVYADRSLAPNERFPDMKGLVDEIHGLGLKAGIYSSPMTLAFGTRGDRKCLGSREGPVLEGRKCGPGGGIGAVGREDVDARRWAEWGFDYLKYDWSPCDVECAAKMRQALDATGRDFVMLVTTGIQYDRVEEYAKYAQMQRSSHDTKGDWQNFCVVRDGGLGYLPFVRPGFWYDMDMLAVGPLSVTDRDADPGDPPAKPRPAMHSKFTRDEQITEVALFAFLPSPLFISFEIAWADDDLLDLVSNEELIDVNQDWPCSPSTVEELGDGLRRYVRKMSDGTTAWLYCNFGEKARSVELKPAAGSSFVRDVLARRDLVLSNGALAFVLQPHASRVFRSPDGRRPVSSDGDVTAKGTAGAPGTSACTGVAELKAAAAADAKELVRPGGVAGRPFWNAYSERFTYAPVFDFKPVPGAAKYRFRIIDDLGLKFAFTVDAPTAPLSPVWEKLRTPGFVNVVCEGVDAAGMALGEAGKREFFKTAPFKPGAYPPAVRTYGEAAAICSDYVFSRWYVQDLVKNGTANLEYNLNAYPSKMNAALIKAMVSYAAVRPDRKAEALKVARAAADYVLSISQPKGTPLEYLPPTYLGRKCTAYMYAGQNMMVYPATVGVAFLALAEATGDKKYVEAAERIASTYLRLQGEDGTWYLKIWEKDGKPVTPNRLVPVIACTFLEKLHGATGKAAYRAAADRAFAYVEKNLLPSWNWEGQFEDVPPSERYKNLTKHDACSFAIHVLKRHPGEKKWIELSRDVLRFAEDQFVCWERPARGDGLGVRNRAPGHPRAGTGNYPEWTAFPCVLEQYGWYVPCAPSSAKLIRHYLAQYDAEKNPLDLAKARALGDAYTRAQRPDGRIPTQWTVRLEASEQEDWLNCMCADAEALALLARYDAIDRRVPVVPQPREWKPDGKVVAKVDARKATYALAKDDALGAEGYALAIGADGSLAATAPTQAGLAHARHTVDQLAAAKGPIPTGAMRDWPKCRARGVALDVGRKFMRLETLRALAKDLAHYKMNVLRLRLVDNGGGPFVGKEGHSADRLADAPAPDAAAKDGFYGKAAFDAFVKDCAAMGVAVVVGDDAPAENFDRLDVPAIFRDWEPGVSADAKSDPKFPGLVGGAFAVWNDFAGNGISEDDVVDRFLDALPTLAEKTWTGAVPGFGWEDFRVLAAATGEAPGVNLADRPTGPDGTVGPDDAAIGWRGTGEYEASFDLLFDDASRDVVLFDDGTSQVTLFKGGRIGFSRDGYDWSAPCELPANAPVHLVFRGTNKRVAIFADGRRIGDSRDMGIWYKDAKGEDAFAPISRTLHFPLVRVPRPGVRVWNLAARAHGERIGGF